MQKLHGLLKGSSPSVDDIVYVRKYIHLAIAYLRNRAQQHRLEHAAAQGESATTAPPRTELGAVPVTEEVKAPIVPELVNIEPINVDESIAYLSRLLEKHGPVLSLWEKLKLEHTGRGDGVKLGVCVGNEWRGTVTYDIASPVTVSVFILCIIYRI